MESETLDHVSLPFPPPVAYAIAVALGVGIDLAAPFPVLPMAPALIAGAVLAALAGGLAVWATRTMLASGEHPDPERPTTAIVAAGPYRFSRNPMYLSISVLGAGVALLVNSGWGLLLLVPAVAVTHFLVIAREERYLEGKFGAEYSAYRQRVRRWL